MFISAETTLPIVVFQAVDVDCVEDIHLVVVIETHEGVGQVYGKRVIRTDLAELVLDVVIRIFVDFVAKFGLIEELLHANGLLDSFLIELAQGESLLA